MQIGLNTSHITGNVTPQSMSFCLMVQATARPHKDAIIFEGQTLTYGELYSRSLAIGAQLKQLGINRQDRVGVLFPNHPDFVATFFAVVGLGAVVVPVNPLLKSEEISHILSDSGARLLVVHSKSLPEVVKALPATKGLETIVVAAADGSENNLLFAPDLNCTTLTADKTVPTGSFTFSHSVNPELDLALIVYTSGTTGKPKGARLTHASVLSVLPSPLLTMFDIDHNDRCLGLLPLCHIYGIGVVMFGMLSRGGSVVIMNRFDPKEALDLIQKEKVTILPAVPSIYQFMVMELEAASYDMTSVRICFCGAAPLAPELIGRIESTFQARVIEGYGMSETICGATINPLHNPRPGSIGKVLPGMQISIVSEEGWMLPDGPEHVGEIAIKGPNVMQGYHNHPDATSEVIKDGWFLTGDLGYRDSDGYLYIVGRKKEMIIRGGQNIYPREIEDVVARMDGVREVAVIGIPDQFMGERVKAIVTVSPGSPVTEDSIKEFCGQHLAPYKVPRLVELRTDLLPRNSTGKVLKRLLT